MPKPVSRRAFCTYCGRHRDECGELSNRGICQDCSSHRNETTIRQMAAHDGPQFKRWRARSIQAAGGILPDDLKPYAD